jgi:hypothetical protein
MNSQMNIGTVLFWSKLTVSEQCMEEQEFIVFLKNDQR